jgi:hypothetical protein
MDARRLFIRLSPRLARMILRRSKRAAKAIPIKITEMLPDEMQLIAEDRLACEQIQRNLQPAFAQSCSGMTNQCHGAGFCSII